MWLKDLHCFTQVAILRNLVTTLEYVVDQIYFGPILQFFENLFTFCTNKKKTQQKLSSPLIILYNNYIWNCNTRVKKRVCTSSFFLIRAIVFLRSSISDWKSRIFWLLNAISINGGSIAWLFFEFCFVHALISHLFILRCIVIALNSILCLNQSSWFHFWIHLKTSVR